MISLFLLIYKSAAKKDERRLPTAVNNISLEKS